MNNCIGLRNHKSFILFCMYTALASIYAGLRAGVEVALCFSSETYECNTFTSEISYIFGFVGVAICALFALFTAVMFFDQVHMKIEDTSTIDSMKGRMRSEEYRRG